MARWKGQNSILINGHKVILNTEDYNTLRRIIYKPNGNTKNDLPLMIDNKGYVKYQIRYDSRNDIGLLHHLIIGKPLGGLVVDHINGDPLDNRRSNLRIVSVRMNAHNTKNNSKYIGVRYDKRYSNYQARIMVDGIRECLGSFKCPKEASAAYNKRMMEVEGGKV